MLPLLLLLNWWLFCFVLKYQRDAHPFGLLRLSICSEAIDANLLIFHNRLRVCALRLIRFFRFNIPHGFYGYFLALQLYWNRINWAKSVSDSHPHPNASPWVYEKNLSTGFHLHHGYSGKNIGQSTLSVISSCTAFTEENSVTSTRWTVFVGLFSSSLVFLSVDACGLRRFNHGTPTT